MEKKVDLKQFSVYITNMLFYTDRGPVPVDILSYLSKISTRSSLLTIYWDNDKKSAKQSEKIYVGRF